VVPDGPEQSFLAARDPRATAFNGRFVVALAGEELAAEVARNHLAHIGRIPIRLLGDAVLRRRAWELADRLGWAQTYNAEYVALTQLQADAFITLDKELARSVKGIVETASLDALA
jgi:predicted nucleic acid-binding protein